MGKLPDHENVPYYGLFYPQQSSDCSSGSSSSSLSNGFNNDREICNDLPIPNASYFIPPPLDVFPNGFSSQYMAPMRGLGSKSTHDSSYKINERFVDEMGLSQRFSGINIGGDELNNGTKMKGFDGFGFGLSDYNAMKFVFGAFNNEGFQSSLNGVSYSNFDDLNRTLTSGIRKDPYISSMGSSLPHNLSNNICSGSTWYTTQSEKGGNWINWDSHYQSQNPSMFSQPVSIPKLDSINKNFRARRISIPNNGFSHPINEDSLILQGGKSLNHHFHSEKRNDLNEISARGKSIKLDDPFHDGSNWLNIQKPIGVSIDSLGEVQGNSICLMAQDQNGCRLLQRIFEQGTKDDIQMIFQEIVGHVVELMLKPFGNHVIQKFLDVCDEKQRLKIVMSVTEEPGQLVRICLNTYGTRSVQKLIETLKTRQQITFVIMALKPGFLDLVKDQNGNHVIQRCLEYLSNEDNKFIFDGAARFCVEIATHRHGCCVMQRCITHSTGRSRDKLVTEISKNSLLLAQDPFGNYVVQYIVQLKCPSAVVNLLSQFKRHYVHLSMQKFSSHVVENCLKHLDESREQIVRELVSVSHFEQLLQDPFANYVIQSALAFTKGPLHTLLVDAVRPHIILRTNPYSKRIFSKNLLRK